MAWVDLSGAFGYGTKLTSTQMQNLRDNLTALANGDTGSPKIQAAAIDPGVVAYTHLNVGTQEQSQTINAGANHVFVLTGGGYVFNTRVKSTLGTEPLQIVTYIGTPGTSYSGPHQAYQNTSTAVNDTFYCWHTYITSSGEVFWLFILVDKKTDKLLGMSICQDHPCYGHGVGPDVIPHPFLNYDPAKHKIHLANPDFDLMEKVKKESPDSWLDGIRDLCDIKDGGRWPDMEITVMARKRIIIPKLDYVKMVDLRWNGPKA